MNNNITNKDKNSKILNRTIIKNKKDSNNKNKDSNNFILTKKALSFKGFFKNRIIVLEQAKEMLKQGYFGIDPHCHSSYSFDVPDVPETSPSAIVKRQALLGLKPVITDHDTLNGYNYLRRKNRDYYNNKMVMNNRQGVIPAVEVSIKPNKPKFADTFGPIHTMHINVFGLNNTQLEDIEEISKKYRDLDMLIKYFKDEDLKWMYNHPFWHDYNEKINWKVIPTLAKHYFDVLEVNMNRPKSLNDLTIHLAENLDKGIVSSTDCHIGMSGRVFTICEGKNFNDFWQNIIEKKAYIVRKDLTTLSFVKESSAIIRNIFRANVNTSQERRLTRVTGIKNLDNMFIKITNGAMKNMYFTKKFLHTILTTMNYTIGPILAWRIYMLKENNLAEEIKKKIDTIIKNTNIEYHRRYKEYYSKYYNKKILSYKNSRVSEGVPS